MQRRSSAACRQGRWCRGRAQPRTAPGQVLHVYLAPLLVNSPARATAASQSCSCQAAYAYELGGHGCVAVHAGPGYCIPQEEQRGAPRCTPSSEADACEDNELCFLKRDAGDLRQGAKGQALPASGVGGTGLHGAGAGLWDDDNDDEVRRARSFTCKLCRLAGMHAVQAVNSREAASCSFWRQHCLETAFAG
jgi:hypothetical protein